MAIRTNTLKKNKLKGGSTGTSSTNLSSQIENYKTRLANIGKDADAPADKRNWLEKKLNLEEDQNILFDIFEIIDRPRNALFTAVDKAVQGESFLEGLKEGITGETDTSGKDLLVNTFNMEDEEGKLDVSDVLGFGLDIVGDPTNWALFGGKTLLDVGADVAKKGVKVAGKTADNVITAGLKAADTLEANKIGKLAKRAGVSSDDFLRNLDINPASVGSRAQGYQNLKKGLTDVFNQGSTTFGKLKAGKRMAKGSNKLLERTIRPYLDDLQDLSYQYVLRNSDDVAKYADDLAKLNTFTSKKGNTIGKWLKENPGSELTKFLQSEQGIVAEDILNMIQSGKSNVFRKSDIKDFIKTGKFSGNEESVNRLVDLLNNTAERAGLTLDDINPQLVSQTNSNQINELSKTINRFGIDSVEGKAAQDQLEAILRQNSSLTVGNTDTLKQLYKNPQFKNELDNLGLSYNFEYNADEWNRLKNLRQNKDFMDLVSQNENALKEIANITKSATGMTYDDIVNRAGYVRKAQGSIADLEERISRIDDELLRTDITDIRRAELQTQRDALNEQILSGSGSSVNTVFGTQKYTQPAVVANRQYKEAVERQMREIDTQIETLKKGLSREKTDTLVSQFGKVDAENLKLEKATEKLAKQNTTVDAVTGKINKTNDTIKEVSDSITDNIINKSKKIQDQSVTNTFAKQITDVNNLKKQLNKLTKQLSKIGDADDKAVKAILDNLDKVEAQLVDASNQLRKTTAVINGHVDDTIIKSLDTNARKITKYVEESKKLDRLTATRNELTDRILRTKEQVSNLTANLDKTINNINFNLENINPANDDFIKNQIEALSKSKSILESEAGESLFNLNYYAGLEDFVKYTEYTNETARLFSDAITMGVFNDENVIKTAANIGDNPDNWVKVSGTNLSNRLNAIQNMISGKVASKDTKALMTSLQGNSYWMDPRMASLFGVVSAPKQNTNALLNIVDKFNTTFKKFSTLTPGFQLRNYVGNSFNMYLSGMPVGQIVPYQAKATKLLNRTDDLLKKVREVGESALDEVDLNDWNLLKQFYEGGFSGAGKAARDLEAVQRSVQLGSKYNPINKLSDININLNETADAMNRMALLMYANDDMLKGGKYLSKLNAENPIQAVKYALMDPSNMSEVEQNVIKKIIPFYTFTKQNLMFQATNLVKNTAKYRNFMKALEDSYNDLPEDSYYDYQKSAMQIPIPGANDANGNQLFLKANLPLSDLGEFLSNPIQRIASSSTPLIKAPVEAITGKSLYTGDDTTYNNFSKALTSMGINNQGLQDSAQAAELILNNFGLQNVSTNIVKKVQAILDNNSGDKTGQQLWAEIFRSILQSTNAENVINSGLYDDLEAYQAEIRNLKNQGIDVPTIREITSSNKLKVNNLKKKRASSK